MRRASALACSRFLPLALLLALLGATALAYSPGLRGPFLFDDWANLPKLGNYGPVDNPVTLVSYVTSGGDIAPTGRPLAFASFLIDARDWPANPWPFKLTNLLLHLLNGVLLAALLIRLSRWRGLDSRRAAWAGVLGAGLWLVHPLFVSTTLYVVQRMTELAALFVFSGLLAYAAGRARLVAGRTGRGYALMVGGLAGGTLLGALAKENAALLPLLALVLEWTVFAAPEASTTPPGSRHSWLAFRLVCLWLPSAAILVYLLRPLGHAGEIIPDRGYSTLARLVSEPRILTQYLYYLAIPHAGTGGLVHEARASTGLLHPWTTLPCIVLVLGLIAFGFAVRKRWPALAAAILFYFAGQLLESTTLPLELYFEHRNYLPAALALWPLALWTVRGPGAQTLRMAIVGGAFAMLLALTALRASLWSSETQLSLTWMTIDRDSPRALVWGTETLASHGRPDLALAKLRAAGDRFPHDSSVALSRLALACELNAVRPGDLRAVDFAARRDRVDSNLIYSQTLALAERLSRRPCPPLNLKTLQSIPTAALANPTFSRYPGIRQTLLVLRGRLALQEGDTAAAYKAFDLGLRIYPKPDAALLAASLFAEAKAPERGIAILDEYKRLTPVRPPTLSMAALHRWWLDRTGWYAGSFERVRKALNAELTAGAGP